MVDSCLREADFLTGEIARIDGEIARIDGEIARYALGCTEIRRLMTIPGVSVTTAATLMATIGRIDRFPSARHLVGYIGLDPRSRQSGVSAIRLVTSQSRARPRHVTCSAKLRTPRCAPRGRCEHSALECVRAAAARSRRSPSPASSSA
jgi:transposase